MIRQSNFQKREIIITIFFYSKSNVSEVYSLFLLGFWKVSEGNLMWHSALTPLSVGVTILYSISFSADYSTLNSAENEIWYYIILLMPLREESERNVTVDFHHWPFKNPEGENKPPKRRIFNKKRHIYNYLSFLNFVLPRQNSLNIIY